MGRRSDQRRGFRQRSDVDRSAAPDSDQRTAGRPGDIFLDRDHRGGIYPAVHHAGGRRPDLQPDGADLCLRAGRSAAGDVHRDALPRLAAAAGACPRGRDHRGARLRRGLYAGAALVAAKPQSDDRDRDSLSALQRFPRLAARQRVPADAGRRQPMDTRDHAADNIARSRHAHRQQNPRNSPSPSRSCDGRFPAWPAGRWQRCGGILQRRVLRAAEAL